MTIAPDACADMPFDQYQRYRLVADVLLRIRKEANEGKPLRVLDVGGRTALLRRFLPEDHVFLVDVEASEEEGLVLGDGSKLPYKDGSFDAVATFDTLEHVPPAGREAFLAECRRVTRGWVVVAGPYDTPRVAEAEVELREFLTHKLETKHRYLNEHHENGLPSLDRTESKLRELGGQVHSVAHGNIDRWLAMMCLSFYMDRDAPLRGIAGRFHRFYNESLYASDHAAPVYRHAVVASFNGRDPSTVAPRFETPVAPTEAMERVRFFANELLVFDAKRDVFEKERARLTEVNDGLVTDLDQHKQKLSELEGLYAERGTVLDELRQDVAEYESGTRKLEKDLSQQQSESEEVELALRADLKEHASALHSLRSERAQLQEAAAKNEQASAGVLQELRGQIAAHEQVQVELRADIEARVTHGETLSGELLQTRAAAGEMEASLARLHEEAAERNTTVSELHSEIGRRGEALESMGANLESQNQRLGELEGERTRAMEELERLRAEMEATEAERAHFEAALATRTAELNEVREVANSRLKSLGRALAPKKKRF